MNVYQIDENGTLAINTGLPNDADSMEVLVATNPNSTDDDPMGVEDWIPYAFSRSGPIRIVKMRAADRGHIETWMVWSTDGSAILSHILADYEDAFRKA